jgi:hypothetical protein
LDSAASATDLLKDLQQVQQKSACSRSVVAPTNQKRFIGCCRVFLHSKQHLAKSAANQPAIVKKIF